MPRPKAYNYKLGRTVDSRSKQTLFLKIEASSTLETAKENRKHVVDRGNSHFLTMTTIV